MSTRQPKPSAGPSKTLDVFDNPNPERHYQIHMQVPEFTCLCPLTGQPDFASFTFDFVPDRLCIELKSLKLYMWSFRDLGAFHEKVTNDILSDMVEAISPRYLRVVSHWNVRGGIYTNVVAEHRQAGFTGGGHALARFDQAVPSLPPLA